MRVKVEVNVVRQGRIVGHEGRPVGVLAPRWVEGTPDEPLVVAVAVSEIKRAIAVARGANDHLDTVEFTVVFEEGP